MNIELRQGDLTEQTDAEAIVYPANTLLLLGAGVAGRIAQRGGDEVVRAASARAPLSLGDVADTPGGALPVRYVLHAAVVGYRPEDVSAPKKAGALTSEETVALATSRSLALAEALGCVSVAFSPLGTGLGGLTPEDSAKAMLRAMRDYTRERPRTRLERVSVVCPLAGEREDFSRTLAAMPAPAPAPVPLPLAPSDFDDELHTRAHPTGAHPVSALPSLVAKLPAAEPSAAEEATEIRRSVVAPEPSPATSPAAPAETRQPLPAPPKEPGEGTSDW